MSRSACAGGHARLRFPPLGSWAQSSFCEAAASDAVVVPLTGTDSKARANFSTASVPHALASVVVHAPRDCSLTAPCITRGTSSCHRLLSTNSRSSRSILLSPSVIRHQHCPPERCAAVPCQLSRERTICSASASLCARSGTSCMRSRMFHHSITVASGHKLGSMMILPSIAALAWPALESASNAAIFLSGDPRPAPLRSAPRCPR